MTTPEKALAEKPIQESHVRKHDWLSEVELSLPIGTRVRVLSSDIEEHVGQCGVVEAYDLGCQGEWPLVSVILDGGTRDGFYDDELSTKEIP